jgi:NOL1/NOP2/sun family putative RNA methylase
VINDNFQSYREIIPEFSQFQESLRRPLLSHLRVNRLKVKPDLLVKRLTEKGIDIKRASEGDETLLWAPDLKSPGNLLEYFLGYIHPQALTSCLVSIVLSPRPDSYVLDMCASPGGKTSHMAQLMDNTGLIIANELYPSRHIPLGHTLARLGVLNAVFTGYQAQEFPLKEQRFDHILADVPCSGEGRFRITGEHSRSRKGKGKAKLFELQKKIILRGFDLLKDKGEMVYATCTYNPEENESVVNFLLKNREAELLPVNIGINHEPGLSKWRKERYDEQLRRAVRVYPHHVDSVGFFMAKIGRRH